MSGKSQVVSLELGLHRVDHSLIGGDREVGAEHFDEVQVEILSNDVHRLVHIEPAKAVGLNAHGQAGKVCVQIGTHVRGERVEPCGSRSSSYGKGFKGLATCCHGCF